MSSSIVLFVACTCSAADDPKGHSDRSAAQALVGISLTRYDDAQVQKFPWGWIRWVMNSKIDPKAEMTMGIVHIEPNQTNPLHIHPNSAEYLHVIAGSCEHRIGDKWVTMKAGDTVRLPKDVPHNARTTGESCRAIIVYDTGVRQMVPVADK